METWSDIFKSRKFWAAIVASLILKEIITRLSVLTSAGALRLWGKALYIITLGSARVRDAPYASAALNPYPVPPLMVLVFLLCAFITFNFRMLTRAFVHIVEEYLEKKNENKNIGSKIFSSKLKIEALVLSVSTIYIGAFCLLLIIPVGVENEAVAARRIYEADRDIVAPYLTSSQLIQLQSDFAQIETKSQYKAFMGRLSIVAKEHQVRIHEVTW
jgi:hypothetical protein